MYKTETDVFNVREGLSRYNHVSNGGYSFRTFIRENSQFLEITLSNYGMGQTTIIDLNKNTIQSLLDVLQHAKLDRQVVGLDDRESYTVTTPEPDPSYKEFYEQLDKVKDASPEPAFDVVGGAWFTKPVSACAGHSCSNCGQKQDASPETGYTDNKEWAEETYDDSQTYKKESADKYDPRKTSRYVKYLNEDESPSLDADKTIEDSDKSLKEEILEVVDGLEEFFISLLNKTKK
jgi:hypothetical protein